MDRVEESAVSEIFKAARIPWCQLDGRTQRNKEGNVVKLRFSPCLELEEIPQRIGDLSSLEEIYLFWASRRLTHLPSDGFDRLHNLRVLQLRWCQGIKELPPLCDSIEELVIEGCDNIVDLSSFREAKRTWKRLRSLNIIQIGSRGVASLVEAFSTDDERRVDADKIARDINSNQLLSHTSSIFFPSLTFLSLRHDTIDQADLAKLWPFFRRCPRLTKIDLGNNNMTSLEKVVPVATARGTSESESGKQELLQMALRELNLAGNPVCTVSPYSSQYHFNNNHTDENNRERAANGDGNEESELVEEDILQPEAESQDIGRDLCQMKRFDRQDENLLKIVTANPQLVSILVCSGDCQQSSGSYHDRCDCFRNSALYSPSVRHALDLNQCSKGNTLMGTRATISYDKGYNIVPKSFPLSWWALILARTNQIFDLSPTSNDSTYSSRQCHRTEECQECWSETQRYESHATERALQERQASVIYSLLQGPAFVARGNQFTKG